MSCLCLAYDPYFANTHKISGSQHASVWHRMRSCLKRIQPMFNVPLANVSVRQRMSDIFHTLAYAGTIRNRVTGP